MSLPHQGERRAAARHVCHRPCLIRLERTHFDGLAGSIGAGASVRDLSACGAGLALPFHVAPGADLAVGPLGRDGPPLLPARVIRCVPVGGRWHHGCTLARRLTDAELRAWLN
jgi:hypothetical protein